MRVVLDTSAADHLVEPDEAFATVRVAIEAGQLVVLLPDTTRRELEATLNPDKRKRLIALAEACRPVPDGSLVIGWSAIGRFRVGDKSWTDRLSQRNTRHIHDAAIAAVTMFEDAVLVTEDPRQARQTISLMRRAWTAARLLQRVSDQLGNDHQQRR